ncbi:MAG: hypothetical protein HN337_00875, partial [Deltaproteobacteria bacterium]|nr:hypothetical protein [Deltaproteobacteria bacterium]
MATFKFTRGDGKVLVYIPVKQEMYLTDGPGAEEIEAKHDSSSGVTSGCIPSVRFPPSFDIVDLHLTYACNMNCVYCYANASTKGPVLSRNKILQALNYLFSKSTSDDLRVHFL